jgi:hypothetical protein
LAIADGEVARMKTSQREWGTNEALGIASIIEAATRGGYSLDQDLKGRWHVWLTPMDSPDSYDAIARQLEADVA